MQRGQLQQCRLDRLGIQVRAHHRNHIDASFTAEGVLMVSVVAVPGALAGPNPVDRPAAGHPQDPGTPTTPCRVERSGFEPDLRHDVLGDRAVLEASEARVVLVAADPIEDLPESWTWIQGTRIDETLLAAHVPDIAQRHVYVSGPPAMVAGAAARHLHAASVRTDYFSGY